MPGICAGAGYFSLRIAPKVRAFYDERNIHVVIYSPLGTGT